MRTRFYAVFRPASPDAPEERAALYRALLGREPGDCEPDPRERNEALANLRRLVREDPNSAPIEVEDVPTLRFRRASERGRVRVIDPPVVIVSFSATSSGTAARFRERLRSRGLAGFRAAIGSDPVVAALDSHWWPQSALGRRSDAFARVGWPAQAPDGTALQGQGVNLVVFNSGVDFDRAGIPPAQRGTQFPPDQDLFSWPPRRDPLRHGTMIARILHALAPRAIIHSARGLPPPPAPSLAFLGDLEACLELVREAALDAPPGERWVFVHAWGLLDRRIDLAVPRYADDPGHPFLLTLGKQLKAPGNGVPGFDQVCAAGNCGEFCPDRRCGPADRGEGRSILGANSHPGVLTVGAVATDGTWIGQSSMGPGQGELGGGIKAQVEAARSKPDLVAPSFFADDGDHAWRSGGSSAACAVAAGIVACLRSEASPHRDLSPGALSALLRTTAQPAPGQREVPDRRRGSGILDLGAAATAAAVV